MERELFGICPYVTSQKILSGKWAILVLYHISSGPIRFNELQRRLPDITHATLSRQLKTLEEEGLIIRKEYPQVPPKVEYYLTPIGERFQLVLNSLNVWGNEYIEYLKSKEK